MTRYAIIRGLCPEIRAYVLKQIPTSTSALLEAAKIAEDTVAPPTASLTKEVLEAIRRLETRTTATVDDPRQSPSPSPASCRYGSTSRERRVHFQDQRMSYAAPTLRTNRRTEHQRTHRNTVTRREIRHRGNRRRTSHRLPLTCNVSAITSAAHLRFAVDVFERHHHLFLGRIARPYAAIVVAITQLEPVHLAVKSAVRATRGTISQDAAARPQLRRHTSNSSQRTSA